MKKRSVSEEVEFYTRRDKSLRKKPTFLSAAFLRPVYQYTSLENDTIDKLHEMDWLRR